MGIHVAMSKSPLPNGFVIFYTYKLDGTLLHGSTPIPDRQCHRPQTQGSQHRSRCPKLDQCQYNSGRRCSLLVRWGPPQGDITLRTSLPVVRKSVEGGGGGVGHPITQQSTPWRLTNNTQPRVHSNDRGGQMRGDWTKAPPLRIRRGLAS